MRVVYQIVGFTPILVNSSHLYNMSVFEFNKKSSKMPWKKVYVKGNNQQV
ncbi:hypothetical protein HanPSC8_Chr04g0162381 [Helianthus annuus]|nr:hypothetical protein HanPSC8_Chr04g0162381 [Helianthus annuus]